jgi:SAM-dependent methyltransferase
MFVDQPWDDADSASLYDAFPFTEDLAFFAGLAGTQGGPVLELGCGSGRILVPLARGDGQVAAAVEVGAAAVEVGAVAGAFDVPAAQHVGVDGATGHGLAALPTPSWMEGFWHW